MAETPGPIVRLMRGNAQIASKRADVDLSEEGKLIVSWEPFDFPEVMKGDYYIIGKLPDGTVYGGVSQ